MDSYASDNKTKLHKYIFMLKISTSRVGACINSLWCAKFHSPETRTTKSSMASIIKTSNTCIFFVFLLPGLLFANSLPPNILVNVPGNETITRNDFPEGFIFGAGSAAYQYEGAVSTDGRGPSVWDNFTHQHPEKIKDGSNGDVANDFYNRYKEDIASLKEIGLDSFRFSISWSRILPTGKISGGINTLGIQFYHNLIDELLANGIKPFVTIFHWDMPQALQEEYGGFLSRNIVNDFLDYANILFKEYGNKVQYWTTVNEPNLMTEYGYATGAHAPGRCSNYIGNCSAGDSATEPYIVAHHILLCHAHTVKLYRRDYAYQNGIIGLTGATNMMIPVNNTEDNRLATLRAIDFSYGWFFNPVVYGNYPRTMRSLLGSRLPKFTEKESAMLRQSFDFIGLNYYTTYYAMKSSSVNNVNLSYTTDSQTTVSSFKDGIAIGEATPSVWLYVYPVGIKYILEYVKVKYNNPFIIITENGVGQKNSGSLADDPTILQDNQRLRYHSDHLSYLLESIKEGANVGGYYMWSWLDDFEWSSGFSNRIGLSFVDFDTDLKRYPKDSYYWFKDFLTKKSVADA